MLEIIQQNVNLAPFTSFKVGGQARYFAAPSSQEEMRRVLAWARDKRVERYIFGKGSNLVFSDKGFSGLVIHTGQMDSIRFEGTLVHCEAGALMYTLTRQSVKLGLAGVQKLGGIPGTLGGCVYINAGAYGQETSDTVEEVESCTSEGEVITRSAPECAFHYRESIFCSLNETILGVRLRLRPAADPVELEREMTESLRHRKQTQPLDLPNSGSIFKRPQGRFPGQIIEEASLKGLTLGGAQVSSKHANFIVNTGGAMAQEIYDLSQDVKARVRAHSGITLEHEVRFVGEFLPWPR